MLYKNRDEAYRAYRSAPDRFFEQYHDRWFNERELISPEWTWFETKYHYNLVENGIIDILRQRFGDITGKRVLDVGAGTGHWIDFYLDYLGADHVTGVDFSRGSVDALGARYADCRKVSIRHLDISAGQDNADSRFDIINAIGVMFHIVDNARWEQAVRNLVASMSDAGVAIIGGEFGAETHEMGVMRCHRSLDQWRAVLRQAGAEVMDVRYFDWFKGGVNDGLKNNLLAIVRQ